MRVERKKGLSEVITIILVTLLLLLLAAIISMTIIHKIKTTKEEVESLQVLGLENANIEKAQGDFENGGEINITIKRIFSTAEKSTIKSICVSITGS